jgi:hypothetical protein
MSALGEVLTALKSVFQAHGLRWFVFGAQAVAARAAPRATQDVDVTVDVDGARLAAIVLDLERAGFRHRYPEIAEELLAGGAVLPLVHESGMEVDLVVAASGLEALALSRATTVDVDGVHVPVAHPTDLVVMKTLAGRGTQAGFTQAATRTSCSSPAIHKSGGSQSKAAVAASTSSPRCHIPDATKDG